MTHTRTRVHTHARTHQRRTPRRTTSAALATERRAAHGIVHRSVWFSLHTLCCDLSSCGVRVPAVTRSRRGRRRRAAIGARCALPPPPPPPPPGPSVAISSRWRSAEILAASVGDAGFLLLRPTNAAGEGAGREGAGRGGYHVAFRSPQQLRGFNAPYQLGRAPDSAEAREREGRGAYGLSAFTTRKEPPRAPRLGRGARERGTWRIRIVRLNHSKATATRARLGRGGARAAVRARRQGLRPGARGVRQPLREPAGAPVVSHQWEFR